MSNGVLRESYGREDTLGDPSFAKSSSLNSTAAKPQRATSLGEHHGVDDGPSANPHASKEGSGDLNDASSNGSFSSFAGNNYNSNSNHGGENEDFGDSYERRSEAGSENDWKQESAFRKELSEDGSQDKLKLSRYVELCGEYEAKLCGLECEKQDLIHERDRLSEVLQGSEKKIAGLESKISEIEKLKSLIAGLEAKAQNLDSENYALSKKLEDMEAAEASWKQERTAADEEINALQKAKLDSDAKALDLEEQVVTLLQEKVDLQEEKLRVEEQLKSSYQKLDSLTLDLDSARSELELSKASEASATAKLAEWEEKTKKSQHEIEELKLSNSKFQKDLADAVHKLENPIELKAVETKIQEMQKAMEEKEEREKKLVEELEGVKSELKETRNSHIRLVARVNEANGHIDVLKSKLLEAETGNKTTLSAKRSLEKKWKDEEDAKNALVQSNTELRNELNELANKNKSLTEECSLKDGVIAEMKKQLALTALEANESQSMLNQPDGTAVKTLSGVEKELADVLKEKEALARKVKEQEASNAKLKRDLSRTEDDNRTFFHKISFLTQELNSAREEVDSLKTEKEALILKSRDMDATVLDAIATKERLALQVSDLDRRAQGRWSGWALGAGLLASSAVAAAVIIRIKSASGSGGT